MKKYFYTMIIFLFFVTVQGFSQNKKMPPLWNDSEVLVEFGDYLLSNGFLQEAEAEYKRSLFMNNTSIDNASKKKNELLPNYLQRAIFSLCSIYNAQNNKDGILFLSKNYRNNVDIEIQEKIDLVDFKLMFIQNDKNGFMQKKETMGTVLSLYSKDFSNLILISYDVLNMQIQNANIKASLVYKELEIYKEFVNLSSNYKTKSPVFAALLSTLIPGSGRWYSGSFAGFASSFLGIASFSSACVYTGIKTEWKNWRPYVYASVATVLYITDIYGSYKSAERYNKALYLNLCKSLETVYEEIY